MRSLRVSHFSCIDQATLDFHQITVIIGPQASGKSVLCKLGYFFQSLLNDQFRFASELESFASFKGATKNKFLLWFPIESWGHGKFEIIFSAGDYEVRITRTEYKGKLGQAFRIHFSEAFQNLYSASLEAADKIARPALEKRNVGLLPVWELRESVEKLQSRLLGNDYIEGQLFVPAGRSFFTSIGRAIAAFEQGNTLDPVTITFGRIFRSNVEMLLRTQNSQRFSRAFNELLGGEVRRVRDTEYLSTKDGRKIPLSLLSSGQQELLPLLTVLIHTYRRLLYIEEPEAHLFPSAQSKLVELLTALVNTSKEKTKANFVITTHSPYVLAKFNNLILAGSLGKSGPKEAIASIVPRESWITSQTLRAYAICDGKTCEITGADGLINADYLDDVSGAIAEEFEKLLDLEVRSSAISR